MSFAAKGVVPPDAAFALVLGANLGTAINPVLEGVSGDDPVARRLPIGNLLNRALGCVVGAGAAAPDRPADGAVRCRPGARGRRFPHRLQPDRGGGVPAGCWAPTPGCCASCCRRGSPRTIRRGRATWTRRRWRSPPIALAAAAREALRMADALEAMLGRARRGAGEHRPPQDRRGAAAGRRAGPAEHARSRRYLSGAGPRGPGRGGPSAPVAEFWCSPPTWRRPATWWTAT